MNAEELIEQYQAGKRDFRHADLTGADLTGADLTGANSWHANLTGANLRGANLWHANLRGADLTDANLRGADLTGANLTGARFILVIVPGGSDLRALVANMHADGIRVYRGCFAGTLSEFIEAVQKKAEDDPTREYYTGVGAVLAVQQKLWRSQLNKDTSK